MRSLKAFVSSAKPPPPTANPLGDLFASRFSPLSKYYEYWRERIRELGPGGGAMSNGWAYATWSGLASYEEYITADPNIRRVYQDRAVSLEAAAEAVGQRLGGVILYGYGNLRRESQLIQCLTAEDITGVKKCRIYMLDASVFYHLLANSSANPMLRYVGRKSLHPVLIDFESTHRSVGRALKWIRNDLCEALRPVLHVFLGNTFGNLEAAVVSRILDTYTHPGDLILAEYVKYPQGSLQDLGDDYVISMTNRACAELFSVSPEQVEAAHVGHGTGKCVRIVCTESDGGSHIEFLSMLRRQFVPRELLDGDYRLVLEERDAIPGLTKVAMYKRLAEEAP
jgi:hypothetical protein